MDEDEAREAGWAPPAKFSPEAEAGMEEASATA